jgi:hypothetical protein
MSNENKKLYREQCNLSVSYFQFLMTKLKQSKVIVNDKINKKFVPNITGNNFKLLLLFDINDLQADNQEGS